jgi:hypothetical protein
MKYQVDREKLVSFIHNRPAMVKNVTNVTEEFALGLFKENDYNNKATEIYGYLPEAIKTLKITRKFIKTASSYRFHINDIPDEIKKQLTKNDREDMLNKRVDTILDLPNPTVDEWTHALQGGFSDLNKIPRDIWTKEMVFAYIDKSYSDLEDIKDIAMPLWTEDLALKCAKVEAQTLDILPPSMLTKWVVEAALFKQGGYCLDDCYKNIPDESWDEELVAKAVESTPYNIKYVPARFITEELCVAAARDVRFDELPIQTYPVLVAYAAGDPGLGEEAVKKFRKAAKSYDPYKFIMDVIAAEGNIKTLLCLGYKIDEDTWLKILDINPAYIQDIEKANQTDAIIDKFFSLANAKLIDEKANAINLIKIKAHHAPMLINCENRLMIEIMNKYLKGDQTDKTEDTIEIDVPPSEYAKIKSQLVKGAK